MAWANGYNYRVSIPIGPSDDGALTDHRATITIVQGAGTNSAGIIYLNSHALNWPNDIRFTSDAAGLVNLYFWRQESDATDGTWIVLIPSVAATGNTTIYLWYGKTSDSDASNGLATCIRYENWDRNNCLAVIERGGSGDWTYDGGNGQCRWGSIALVDGTFHMFHTNGNLSTSDIGRKTSTDLINWSDAAGNPIIEQMTGPVLLEAADGKTLITHDSKIWMITNKYDGSAIQVRSADSIDGSWTLVTDNAVVPLADTWRATKIYSTSFEYYDGVYYIWLQGYNNPNWKIGYATATDPAGPYTVCTDPVLIAGLAWEGTIVVDPIFRKFGDTFYLFYTGNSGTSCYNTYATASAATGPYTKSEIKIADIGQSFAPILYHDGLYWQITDDLNTGKTSKDLYYSRTINGLFTALRWGYAGSPTVSSSELLINANGERVWTTQTDLYKRLICRLKLPSTLVNYHYFGYNVSSNGAALNCVEWCSYASSPYLLVASGDASNTETTTTYDAGLKNAYALYEVRWTSGQAKYYQNGVLVATHTTRIPSTAQPVHFVDFGSAGNLYIDWIAVLDCPADFPEWQTPSSEQSASLLISPNRRTFKTLIVR